MPIGAVICGRGVSACPERDLANAGAGALAFLTRPSGVLRQAACVILTECQSCPAKERVFAAKRTTGGKCAILTGFWFFTLSAESGFHLTPVHTQGGTCAESGGARQPSARSAFFLTCRRKASPRFNERKKRRKARLKPALRTGCSGVADKNPVLCAQNRASLLIKKVFLPQRRPRLSAKKIAPLLKDS